MKFAILVFCSALVGVSPVQADPIMAKSGQTYQGSLYQNERPTGRGCEIILESVSDLPKLGTFCTQVDARFALGIKTKGYQQNRVNLTSSISNDHLAEYPVQKTCALPRDGSAMSSSIYTSKDDAIYNRILSGVSKSGMTSFDFFILVSPTTRLPVSARLHRMTPLAEINYDCENLQLKK